MPQWCFQMQAWQFTCPLCNSVRWAAEEWQADDVCVTCQAVYPSDDFRPAFPNGRVPNLLKRLRITGWAMLSRLSDAWLLQQRSCGVGAVRAIRAAQARQGAVVDGHALTRDLLAAG